MPTVEPIIEKYENHSSTIIIHTKVDKSENRYDICLATEEQISKVIKKLNSNKATGQEKISV